MPIYEYRCKSCGNVFEVIQRLGDPQPRKCRECSGRLEKLISQSAFHLKGGGWYSQGYHKSGSKKTGESKKSGETETSAKSKKTGAKPSSSADSKSASGSGKD